MTEQKDQKIIDAINDLARVVIACDDTITSKSEAIRRLHLASIAPSRIANLLSMPAKDVTSLTSKLNKKNGGRKERRRG